MVAGNLLFFFEIVFTHRSAVDTTNGNENDTRTGETGKMKNEIGHEDAKPCWEESKAAEMIDKIRRSEWAPGCFADVKHFLSEGYCSSVALAMAWKYWGA